MAILKRTDQIAPDAAKLDDIAVLERSFSDPRAFEVLVNRYQDGFLRASYRVVRSREEAEDITQEVFVKIYLRGRKFQKQEGATFKSWAYKILLNTAYTHWRRQKKRELPLGEFFDVLLYEQAFYKHRAELASFNRRDMVESALEEIPKDLAELLRMHYFEGYSYRDISFKTGLTVSALKMRLYRARQKFRDYFLKVSKSQS